MDRSGTCTGRAKHELSGTRTHSYEDLAAAMLDGDGAKKETIGFVGGACSAERASMVWSIPINHLD